MPGLIHINTEQYLHTHWCLSNLRLELASSILSINYVRHCYVMSHKDAKRQEARIGFSFDWMCSAVMQNQLPFDTQKEKTHYNN